MNFNLNSPLDFARLVSGDASRILSQFNKTVDEWSLLEGGYLADVTRINQADLRGAKLFHIFQENSDRQGGLKYGAALASVQDQGGRRKVAYKFPYRDGQTTADLGREPETFTMECVLYGEDYFQAFTDLLGELNKPTAGILIHPVRGRIPVAFQNYRILHTHEMTKAMSFSLTFMEHTYDVTVSDFTSRNVKSVKQGITKALSALETFSNFISKVEANLNAARTLKNQITALVNDTAEQFALLLGAINATFNGGSSTDIPGLVPTNGGGTGGGGTGGGGTGGGGTVGTFPVATTPSDPFNSIPVATISEGARQAVASERIIKDMNAMRTNAETFILLTEGADNGQGALEMYAEILSVRQAMIDIQDAFEAGVASSRARVIEYILLRDMSVREVAFACGLSPDQGIEIDLLNPEILCLNNIPKGTHLKVPVT